MPLVSASTKTLQVKIVFYGPGLSGKTTNLEQLNKILAKERVGEMMSLDTTGDRTLFFDWMPLDLGKIRGFDVRIQLYTVPGQVRYNKTRQQVLRGADGLVFVADSQKAAAEQNVYSFNNLRENLVETGIDMEELPMVIQCNKKDLPETMTTRELAVLLKADHIPFIEAVAFKGKGVAETLRVITRLTLKSVQQYLSPSKLSILEKQQSNEAMDGDSLLERILSDDSIQQDVIDAGEGENSKNLENNIDKSNLAPSSDKVSEKEIKQKDVHQTSGDKGNKVETKEPGKIENSAMTTSHTDENPKNMEFDESQDIDEKTPVAIPHEDYADGLAPIKLPQINKFKNPVEFNSEVNKTPESLPSPSTEPKSEPEVNKTPESSPSPSTEPKSEPEVSKTPESSPSPSTEPKSESQNKDFERNSFSSESIEIEAEPPDIVESEQNKMKQPNPQTTKELNPSHFGIPTYKADSSPGEESDKLKKEAKKESLKKRIEAIELIVGEERIGKLEKEIKLQQESLDILKKDLSRIGRLLVDLGNMLSRIEK